MYSDASDCHGIIGGKTETRSKRNSFLSFVLQNGYQIAENINIKSKHMFCYMHFKQKYSTAQIFIA